tara:strand:- start:2956 stop:3123 length:168 start_codon:yes stop_codon:yes gene_type:complete
MSNTRKDNHKRKKKLARKQLTRGLKEHDVRVKRRKRDERRHKNVELEYKRSLEVL